MSANYTSNKPDGYCSTRNEIYQVRQAQLQDRAAREQEVLRNLPPQTKENYGKKTSK